MSYLTADESFAAYLVSMTLPITETPDTIFHRDQNDDF